MVHIVYLAADTRERANIVKRLRAARLDIHPVSSGREAVGYLRAHSPDVTVVDVSTLPGNPTRLFQRLRRSSPGTAFIVVTQGNDPNPLPQADAHLRKPFTTRTFKARLKTALARREADILQVGPFTLDIRLRRLETPNGTCRLTPIETALMREFLSRAGEVLDRAYLMATVWETSYWEDTRTLDVHIHWLRKKIEKDPRAPQYLVTVYRTGYMFQVPPR